MNQNDLEELLQLEKKFYLKLSETMDTTRELAEAVDRQDSVSLHMLISMRQRPLLELQEIRSYIQLKRVDLEAQDAQRFDQLLAGDAPNTPAEAPVAEQVAKNRRLLERLADLDRRVNQRLCGAESCYEKP